MDNNMSFVFVEQLGFSWRPPFSRACGTPLLASRDNIPWCYSRYGGFSSVMAAEMSSEVMLLLKAGLNLQLFP